MAVLKVLNEKNVWFLQRRRNTWFSFDQLQVFAIFTGCLTCTLFSLFKMLLVFKIVLWRMFTIVCSNPWHIIHISGHDLWVSGLLVKYFVLIYLNLYSIKIILYSWKNKHYSLSFLQWIKLNNNCGNGIAEIK